MSARRLRNASTMSETRVGSPSSAAAAAWVMLEGAEVNCPWIWHASRSNPGGRADVAQVANQSSQTLGNAIHRHGPLPHARLCGHGGVFVREIDEFVDLVAHRDDAIMLTKDVSRARPFCRCRPSPKDCKEEYITKRVFGVMAASSSRLDLASRCQCWLAAQQARHQRP